MLTESYVMVRKALLNELGCIKIIQETPERNEQLHVQNLAKDVDQRNPGLSRSILWEAIYELFTQGILVPVSHTVFRNSMFRA